MFAFAVLVAEVVKHFQPRLVDLHNYRWRCSETHKTDCRTSSCRLHLCSVNCFKGLAFGALNHS